MIGRVIDDDGDRRDDEQCGLGEEDAFDVHRTDELDKTMTHGKNLHRARVRVRARHNIVVVIKLRSS